MTAWILDNYIEILGVLFSLAYLVFSIRQNILLWPMGIVSAVLYVFIFFRAKFYADMGLNVYYFVISIYGWVVWKKGRERAPGRKMPIRRLSPKLMILLTAITAVLFLLIGYILDNYTDSPIPYWDALTTAGSITATWMLARKILEHWIVWIAVDALSVALYIYRGLYPTVVLFLIYTAMAIVGFIEWKKEAPDREKN
ncbi:MAG: nicotinamide mononucleotide transporter [Bacteroidales bacterium]|nr:nicotinamide mononucleotide transporter [Bacteroidales bacterium]MBN2697220.1 nicotinamide mononucleotide transporter [Bacteroidales bacterium]